MKTDQTPTMEDFERLANLALCVPEWKNSPADKLFMLVMLAYLLQEILSDPKRRIEIFADRFGLTKNEVMRLFQMSSHIRNMADVELLKMRQIAEN